MTTDQLHPITAVASTNVFCRPGCPAPSPHPSNVARLDSAREALFRGYRPCLRCRPLETHGSDVSPAALRRAEVLRPLLRAARSPRRLRRGRDAVVTSMLDTPLGPMLAGATDDGVCLLEFTDRPMLPTQLATLERRLRRPIVAGRHPQLDALRRELAAYFAGARSAFDVPLLAPGSPFQERTWGALRTIPAGETISYEELASRAGRPGAQRAAGTANGANRLSLLIPCHRVVRKDGDVGNYGGGRWRKAWLLAHERAMVGSAGARIPQRRSAFHATSTPTPSSAQATSAAT
jgi:O-6-methylguanine DNA methyltransferase